MPTRKEREYYRMGYKDGLADARPEMFGGLRQDPLRGGTVYKEYNSESKPKRKLSAWNKFVKANSKKKIFRYRDGKLNLKKMGVAFRKTNKRGGKR